MTPEFWRWAPLGAAVLFFLVGVLVRIAIQIARTGSSGLALSTKDVRQRIGGATLVAASLVVLIEGVLAALAPERLAGVTLAVLSLPELRVAGLVIALSGTALMFAAQLNLGKSWRIGIDENARPGLVTGGFYAYSRNPIFATVLFGLAGFVLLLPTWLSLAALVAAAVAIRVQISAEEAFLKHAYGDAYASYAKRVGRFVPWLGRI